MNINPKISEYQTRIEVVLEQAMQDVSQDAPRLNDAMRYSLLDGGKRIRALLVYATGEALNIPAETLNMPAAAIECIHAYSLIHDDLPSMDDDELRRGKPTAHIAFDEATAILSGDALQALAFELLSSRQSGVSSTAQINAMRSLSLAAHHMVQGQMLDLIAVDARLTEGELEQMHCYKTGALICSSIDMGMAYASELTPEQSVALKAFGADVGLAFQVQDDILDVEGDTATLGKTQGADEAANKPTYTSIIGLEASRKKVETLYTDAIDALRVFGDEAELLRSLADYIVRRNH